MKRKSLWARLIAVVTLTATVLVGCGAAESTPASDSASVESSGESAEGDSAYRVATVRWADWGEA